MTPQRRSWFLYGFLVLLIPALRASATTMSLHPIADSTLFEAAPNNNLGGGITFMSGLRPNGGRTRGLMLFDLTTLPSGAHINSAALTVTVTETPFSAANSIFDLRRVTQSWGEGSQLANPGTHSTGALAGPNDVSWNGRLGTTAWTAAGGDFSAAASATRAIAGNGSYQFTSSALAADAQGWFDDPANNFGWILMSESERTSRTIRRFASRLSGATAPTLVVDFTVVPEPGTLSLLGLGAVCLLGWTWRRVRG